MQTTHLSTKGQVIIPKEIRVNHGWEPGIKFIIVEYQNGILLRPAKFVKKTKLEDVIGCTGYKGPKRSLKDMEDGIKKGAREHK